MLGMWMWKWSGKMKLKSWLQRIWERRLIAVFGVVLSSIQVANRNVIHKKEWYTFLMSS